MIFNMKNLIIIILDMTAHRWNAPELFSGFHIAASLSAATLAVMAALFFSRHIAASRDPGLKVARVLAVTGWVLVLLEVWKQLFLFFIVNNGVYDWWYFPFQLCSIPMYLCILFPLVSKNIRLSFLTFMCGYTFISAVATLIYPEDILRSYSALTVHGFVWHGILLFISLIIAFSGTEDASGKGLARAALLFAGLCIVAIIINVLAEPVMNNTNGIAHNWAAMFYLNPYHISPQPVVSSIQKTAGIPAGLMLYALSIAIASSIVSKLFSRYGSQ